jgi:prepilin-type N-terminal cleavage/methylation domain-containing protein
MKSASTGTPVESRSPPRNDGRRAGFTLLEALVALALVLAFASVLGPYLFQARRITSNSDGRVAAHALLRTLMDAPFDRAAMVNASREGEVAGLRWRVVAQPMTIDALSSGRQQEVPPWSAFRVVASVSWGPGQMLSAETMRLGKAEQAHD